MNVLPQLFVALAVAALLCLPLDASRVESQAGNPRDKELAAALVAKDAARAAALAKEALAAPLPLPAGHPAIEMLGPALVARLPALLDSAAAGPLPSAELNNLGVALAVRGWTASAAVTFSGSLLVEQPRTARRPWGSALDPYSSSSTTQSSQYFSSTPNPAVINIDSLARIANSTAGRLPQGGRGPYEFFNGLLEISEKRATPNDRLRGMAELFPPVVSRALSDALAQPPPAGPGAPSQFYGAYRAFAQYKGKFLRSLDRRHSQRIATAAGQSERWDDRGLYGFDPAARLRQGEVFVDVYLVDLGDSIATLRREYVAVISGLPPAGQVPGPRVISLGRATLVDEAVNNLWDDLGSRSSSRALDALADRVWRPLAAVMPQGTRRVWLSPDGQLGPVPWQALALAASPQSTVTISIVDSGDTIRERRPRPATASARVLLAGAPDFGNRPGARFQALRHSADEIKAVEQVVRAGGLQPSVLTGPEVERSRLLQALPARIVHIATHGELRDAPFRAPVLAVGPWLVLDPKLRAGAAAFGPNELFQAAMERARMGSMPQALAPLAQAVLALSGANAAGDPFAAGSQAFLSDVDLAALDLSATELVVLPACNLGGSNQSAFQGLMSMQSAVVLAGARGLVASLWPVSDAEAVPFMRRFYENLLVKKLPAAEALAETQRAARLDASGRPRSPFLWAGWTFFGEGW